MEIMSKPGMPGVPVAVIGVAAWAPTAVTGSVWPLIWASQELPNAHDCCRRGLVGGDDVGNGLDLPRPELEVVVPVGPASKIAGTERRARAIFRRKSPEPPSTADAETSP